MAPLLGVGLSLLPQIPKLWNSVAGLFGKKAPESVTEAGKLAGEVLGMIERDEVPVEKRSELEARLLEHKETITRLQNEQHQMYLKDQQHRRDTQVALWANEQKSADLEVQRTRPTILKQMWTTCQIFILLTVIIYGLATFLPVMKNMAELTTIIKYIGGFLFSTFSAAFLGYTTARSVDKRNPSASTGDTITGKAIKKLLGLGL